MMLINNVSNRNMWLKVYPRVIRHFCNDGMYRRTEPPWRILYFGSDEFSLLSLKVIHDQGLVKTGLVEKLDIVTSSERCAVYKYAKDNDLDPITWPYEPEPSQYDLGLVISIGKVIPDQVIKAFPWGVLNVHPSLLPRWRGGAPMIHTLLSGDESTGVSLMQILPKINKFDAGHVLLQREIEVKPKDTYQDLMENLSVIGSRMTLHCLENMDKTFKQAKPQKGKGVRTAHRLKEDNMWINWDIQTPDDIYRHYRATYGLFKLKSEWAWLEKHTARFDEMIKPGVMKDKSVVKFLSDFGDAVNPGFPVFYRPYEAICIRCKNGWVGFKQIQIKKWMSASSFHNGYLQHEEPKCDQRQFISTKSNGLEKYWGKPS